MNLTCLDKKYTKVFRRISLLLALGIGFGASVFSQGPTPKIITGTVTDNNKGVAMERATVKVKGTTNVTITDKDGKFKLKVVPNNKPILLEVSYQGFAKKEVTVTGDEPIKIELAESAANMADVILVDIGYGKVKKKDLTGSVGRVNMEEINKAPVKSFDDALAGRVAGVQVTSPDGEPGSNATIVIRGTGSVTQASSPLYVIDGFPQEDGTFNSINPNDIESIEVLKDASSTAIYGARGANGVIIVTTKRGKTPKPLLTYTGNYGIQKPIHLMEMMKPYEFVRMQNDINPYFTNAVYFSGGKTLDDYKTASFIDWQKIVMNPNPASQNHSLSLSRRTPKTAYTLSASYTNQIGLIVNSGYKRYQSRFTLDKTIKEKLKVGVNVNFASSKSYGQQPSQQAVPNGQVVSNSYWNYMYNVWTFRPVFSGNSADLNNFINNQLVDVEDGVSISSVNPYITAMHELNNRYNITTAGNAYLQYNLTKELTFRATFGITDIHNKNQQLHDSMTNSGSQLTSYGRTNGINGSSSTSDNVSLLNENTFTYNKRFNKDNVLNAVVGFTVQENRFTGSTFTSTKIPASAGTGVDALDKGYITNGIFIPGLNRMKSFLGRVNYNYKSNYLFTVSMRADGSSKFASGHKWGYFPSAAFAWRVSNEKFLQKYSFINDAKLRVSIGATGNNRVGDNAYATLYTPNSGNITSGSYYSFNDQNVYNSVLTQMGNPNLKWESILQPDLGLDLTIFNNIVIGMDYYNKITTNLLVNVSLPYTSGFSSGIENVGVVQNKGFEFSISTTNIRKKNFTWTSSFNISFNDNKLVSLVSGLDQMLSTKNIGQQMSQFDYIAKIGKPVAQFYGYVAYGMYQYKDFYQVPNGANGILYVLKPGIAYYTSSAANSISTINTNSSVSVQPGDPKFKDLNGDGKLDQNDYTTIGRPFPIHFGGFSNNFTYKRFDLSIFTQWSYGNQVINANRIAMEGGTSAPQSGSSLNVSSAGMVNTNQFAAYANRWTPTNPSNLYPRVNANAGGTRQISSRIVEDASYFRIKTVQFGYNFPVKWVKSIKAVIARIYVSAQNLFTFTKYSGPDPEVSTAAGNNLMPGFDYSPYPRTRVVTIGGTITF